MLRLNMNLTAKFCIGLALILTISSMALVSALYFSLNQAQSQLLKSRLSPLIRMAQTELEQPLLFYESDPGSKQQLIRILDTFIQDREIIYAAILSPQKTVIESTQKATVTLPILKQSQNSATFTNAANGIYFKVVPLHPGNFYLDNDIQFQNQNKTVLGYLVLAITTQPFKHNFKMALLKGSWVVLSISIIALIISIILIRRLIRPLHQLIQKTAQVAHGEFNLLPDTPNAHDEISQLKRAFNHMTQEIQRNQSQLQSSLKKAQESDQLKSRFLADMSHEFRTPLNSIIGFSQVLEQELEGPLTSDQKESVYAILNSGKHMLQLVNNLLDFSKIEAGVMTCHPESVPLEPFLKAEIQNYRPLLSPDCQLAITLTPSTMQLTVDPTHLKQILNNLLSNAIKFTPTGTISIEAVQTNSETTIRISDTGMGISEDKLPYIFNRFYTQSPSKKSQEGAGIGLALVHALVHLNNGQITVASTVQKGTEFTIIFPQESTPKT